MFDAINEHGVYLGGAISPGIGISTDALFDRASRLARIDLERPPSAIGTRTETALQSGILFGYVGLGGRHHRSLQGRTGARQSHCHGWLGEADRA